MGFLKLPAGRLATVFYKNEPTEPQDRALKEASMPSHLEKGTSDDILPPMNPQRSRPKQSQDLMDQKGHAFAWKNICLDIKADGGSKRLLDNMDGKPLNISCRG